MSGGKNIVISSSGSSSRTEDDTDDGDGHEGKNSKEDAGMELAATNRGLMIPKHGVFQF
jgi:hypothetical protein